MASSIHRPSRGRPAKSGTSVHTDVQNHTGSQNGDGLEVTPSNRFPEPPISTGRTPENKQTTSAGNSNQGRQSYSATTAEADPATTTGSDWRPTGPPPITPFTRRSARSTRNPSPKYVDAIWTASQSEIDQINRDINRRTRPAGSRV